MCELLKYLRGLSFGWLGSVDRVVPFSGRKTGTIYGYRWVNRMGNCGEFPFQSVVCIGRTRAGTCLSIARISSSICIVTHFLYDSQFPI